MTSRLACSEAEAATAWEADRLIPKSRISPVSTNRHVRAGRRCFWITAGLKSFLLPPACRDQAIVAARKPYSGLLGFLRAVTAPSVSVDRAFEEKKIAGWQGKAVGPALSILIANLDFAPYHGLNADQIPALLA